MVLSLYRKHVSREHGEDSVSLLKGRIYEMFLTWIAGIKKR